MSKILKRKTFYLYRNKKVDIIPYDDGKKWGYIRFEDENGDYLFSIDETIHIARLKQLKDAINSLIREKDRT